MTFQEAATILKADAGTHTEADKQTAIDTVKWYENNQLELEDYQTDQFHTLIDKIRKMEELTSMREQQKLKVDEFQEKAAMVSGIIHTIQLQNDFIGRVESPDELSKQDIKFSYQFLRNSLTNMHELNQHIMRNLDKVCVCLYDVAEELEDQANESN